MASSVCPLIRLVIKSHSVSVSSSLSSSPPLSSPILNSSKHTPDLLSFDPGKLVPSIEDFFSGSSTPITSHHSPSISVNPTSLTNSLSSLDLCDFLISSPTPSVNHAKSPQYQSISNDDNLEIALVPFQSTLSLTHNAELDIIGSATSQDSTVSTIIYTNLTPQEIQDKRNLEDEASSRNTRTNYEYDWKCFLTYFYTKNPTRSHTTADHEDVFSYINSIQSELKMSTIERRIAGIAHYLNFNRSELNKSLKGLANRIGRSREGKSPLLQEHITQILDVIEKRCLAQNRVFNLDIRDRAFILFAFYTGARRSELSDLIWRDIRFQSGSVIVHFRKSKTDQQGEGQDIVILANKNPRYCGVKALLDWKNLSEHISGETWVWRRINKNDQIKGQLKDKQIYLLTKHYCQEIGLDPEKYSPHSFRAGMITQAKMNGADIVDIMKQSRHKSVSTVMTYIRLPDLMKNNVSAGMWTIEPNNTT